jgi:hypothetical protein
VHLDGGSDVQVDVNEPREYSVGRLTCLSRDAMALALSIHSDECRVQDFENDQDFVFVDTVPFL